MEWQMFLFQCAVIVLLFSLHIYHIERKILYISDIIVRSADMRQTKQTEELRQILKDAEKSYEAKMKEALLVSKENLTITLQSMKAANKTNFDDKGKDNTIHNNQNIKEVAHGIISKKNTQHHSFSPGNVNDGNTYTVSSTFGGILILGVDLLRDLKIKQIQIFVRQDCCSERIRQLDVLIGQTYNKLEKCTFYEGPAQTGVHGLFECHHIIRARYVSIKKKDSINLELAEVKVMAFEENLDS